jgi:hypothetical protein
MSIIRALQEATIRITGKIESFQNFGDSPESFRESLKYATPQGVTTGSPRGFCIFQGTLRGFRWGESTREIVLYKQHKLIFFFYLFFLLTKMNTKECLYSDNNIF